MKIVRAVTTAAALAVCALTVSAGSVAAHETKWGGIYIGVNAGWAGSDIGWQYTNAATGETRPPHAEQSSDNFMLGGHVGLQHQMGRFVIGAEASLGGSAGNDSFGSAPCFNPAFNCQARQSGPLLTIGGRLGYTPISNVLLFVSGGYASLGLQTREMNVATGVVNAFDTRDRHSGAYVGGGIEYALTHNWSIGVEYMHLFLDDRQHLTVGSPSIEDRRMSMDTDLVRARLTFKLGREATHQEPMK